MSKFAFAIAGALLFSLAGNAKAVPLSYDISWNGSNGYSMTGQFSFDDTNAGDGRIDETELLTLSFEGFLSGALIGSANLADGFFSGFNFNFDPIAEAFFTGGSSGGLSGQSWNTNSGGLNCTVPGLGFASGRGSQGFCIDDSFIGASSIRVNQSSLTATRRNVIVAVSEPGTLALLGLGLVGLGFARRHKVL